MNIAEGALLIVALGGNAIEKADKKESASEQWQTLERTAALLAELVRKFKLRLVVTHGNGPQVGSLLLQQEAAKRDVLAQSLAVCGAMSQGQIGLQLQVALQSALGADTRVAALLTRTQVDPKDKAFTTPTKPVGPFYTKSEADALRALQPTWTIAQARKLAPTDDAESARVWRRLVASPAPLRVLEADAISALLAQSFVVIAGGGGGVPIGTPEGLPSARLIDAVIDKDLATARLAIALRPAALVIVTDVPHAYTHFATPQQRTLGNIRVSEAEQLLAEGHFGAGSMAPKVAACVNFARETHLPALITDLAHLSSALTDSTVGTRITL